MPDRWLVVSDMDGTFLNHEDYRYEAARPMLARLRQMEIPLIFNTSKTFAELEVLVRQIDNTHPFIMENGSAIAVPENYFSADIEQELLSNARSRDRYLILVTGIGIDSINTFLDETSPDAINFTRCTLEQVVELTGLKPSEASAAQKRQFSVPLYFNHASKESRFIQQAKQAGFNPLRGGRFLHLQGNCNKASSMQLLKKIYQQQYRQHFGVIALGDSHNDQHMLEAADVAIVVKSPSRNSFSLQRSDVFYTRNSAPEGWVEGLEFALNEQN